jgi:hypothetical protein
MQVVLSRGLSSAKTTITRASLNPAVTRSRLALVDAWLSTEIRGVTNAAAWALRSEHRSPDLAERSRLTKLSGKIPLAVASWVAY